MEIILLNAEKCFSCLFQVLALAGKHHCKTKRCILKLYVVTLSLSVPELSLIISLTVVKNDA